MDKWLEALRFENYRLSFTPNPIHAEMLQSHINRLESEPTAGLSTDELDGKLHRLEAMKKDLASVNQLISLREKLHGVSQQLQKEGYFQFSPEDAIETFDGLNAWFEKTKTEQRERQSRNLASLKRFWPQADGARKTRIAELLATYARKRYVWGSLNLRMAAPVKVGRWATRALKQMK